MEKIVNIIVNRSIRFLAFVLVLSFFTYCSSEEEVVTEVETHLTKDSNVVDLIKKAVLENNVGEQCVNYKYPICFMVKKPNTTNYKIEKINSDSDLNKFFSEITNNDKIRIDFPISLKDDEDKETPITSIEDLESTLKITLDACNGVVDYDYCDTKKKKVNICHNGKTLCVSINALKAHLDHGDVLGKCN